MIWKYGYLIPDGFKPDPLKTFEVVWLDVWESLERTPRKGSDVFKEWPEEAVRKKYGHLIKLMPRLPEGLVGTEDEDEQFALNELTDSPMEDKEEETNTLHHTEKED